MRLRRVSAAFFATVIVAMCANALLLWLISQSYDKVVAAQLHRQNSLDIANQLYQETAQLGQLVRAYTATGEPRYLLYYYDILAIRNGEKPAPAQSQARTYWDEVIASRIQHRIPGEGALRSLSERMKLQGFGSDEFQALQQVLDTTAALQKIEQIAFAATQGLYNPQTQEFVSDGTPRLDFASKRVHDKDYSELKAQLAGAVDGLIAKTELRTNAEVVAATDQLRHSILASVAFTLIAAVLVIYASRVVKRQVLSPVQHLDGVARVLAQGDYSARSGSRGGVEEIKGLGRTLDSMAQAIEGDLSHREAIQAELEAARAQAVQATQAKSMFLANMSHEIRTPMNAMIGMSYLALRTELAPRQRDYISKVYNAAKSLLGIINDILDFSKVEAGKIELEQIRFRIEDVAANSLAMLRQRAHDKDIELLFDITEASLLGADSALLGDALRLGQVITNLLSNAVKFTEKGHVTLSIGVQEHHDDIVTLEFSVLDTGIGMSPEQLERLFNEFTQADGSTTRKYGGSGLGLTISKRLVELMGGELLVESELGHGTLFRFALPFRLPTPPAPPATPMPRAAAMRVLVVDDQSDARKSLTDMLVALQVGSSGAGGVEAADDGDAALDCVERAEREGRPFDLLLIDWVMPRLDGAGVLRALAARPSAQRPLPVIVSGYDSEAMHQTAMQLGAQHLLPKPVLPESLRNLFNWLDGQASGNLATPSDAVNVDQLTGMRVLLAEDNAINRQIVVELLETVGVVVDVAVNGQDALTRIEDGPVDQYDVVLMDLQMPVVDGYEAARRIRMHALHFALPIIAVSAHALVEERERCLILGMNQHISKPIEPELLYATLVKFRRAGREALGLPSLATPAKLTAALASELAPLGPAAIVPADGIGGGIGGGGGGGIGGGGGGGAADPLWLAELRSLLAEGDTEAIALWQSRDAQLSGLVPERTAARITSALAEYDFDAAIKLLAALDPSIAQ